MKFAISLLALLVVFSGYLFNESFAEVSENQAFLLEGSGFAVTEEQIKFTEIDLGLSSQDQRGSTINFVIEDGFITLDDEEFIISELEGKFLREGRYIRINGNIESSTGLDTTISFFGRLVAESKDAAVYGFTGRITTTDDTYKIIYTTKLSSLTKIEEISTNSEESDLKIHILEGSSAQKTDNTIPGLDTTNYLRFFSIDRLSIEPGTTITFVNDDIVSHSIISGKENYGDRYDPFTPDGRISTGDIAPGESATITIDGLGIYKLYDPDYIWMKIEAVSFPNVDNITVGTTNNQQGN
ncbi:cupredoxin domain-containing protein [Nitrosopumilus sp.]|uniref:cupredoxin domain-containing protein n=1 Tax=Nitrosopumilus sp. TaxID=2024843 RepID=UPI003D0B2741